ncbi:transcriptional regulator [Raoultella planticola]|nr:transcriptional regulator [Raoultella planticola]
MTPRCLLNLWRFRPNKVEVKDESAAGQQEKPAHTLGKYGAASRLSNRQQIPV